MLRTSSRRRRLRPLIRLHLARLLWITALSAAAGAIASCVLAPDSESDSLVSLGLDTDVPDGVPTLIGRAVLPAASFAPGPTSGTLIGPGPINGQAVPFESKQPIQGFSAVLDNGDGTFLAMCDNGFGGIENSSDFRLRVYRLRPHLETAQGGPGTLQPLSYFELRDPDHEIDFAITNELTPQRRLTGADFDIESMQRAADGSFWFGDEFGPFLLHTDAGGRLLQAPIRLVDPTEGEVRSPQNPYSEESSALRVMNALASHARAHGATRAPVFSPWHVMLADGDSTTVVDNRVAPPAGSGLVAASSELFDIATIRTAGYPVVPYTVDDPARMRALLAAKVDGIISDRPDLLLEVIRNYDANGDGVAGDYLEPSGLIDPARVDAQGHRGGRDLRPENTLPAMEVGLDNLVTTLELDIGITSDLTPVLDHDPHIQSQKCRRTDGAAYGPEDEVLIRSLTRTTLQARYICDKVFRGPSQINDPSASPVTVAYQASHPGLPHIYAMPTLAQLFDFVSFYAAYYRTGPGAGAPDAALRAANADRVRFNIETKINPRAGFVDRTYGPAIFTFVVGGTIAFHGMAARADIQSFDFRTLLLAQTFLPQIRTVYLFGDFPIYDDPTIEGSDDGTNLQPEAGANTPWLAGLFWPYRATAASIPFRARRSGGFEGMALSADKKRLYALLEQPLAGDDTKTLRIYEYELASGKYLGLRATYHLEPGGTNIGDFVMFDATHGLVIERDGSQGNLQGFKRIYQVTLRGPGEAVDKQLAVDLQNIADPAAISLPALPGDVGLGTTFAFPFTTIEDVVILGPRTIAVLNDNNYPFSVGRHIGSSLADDTEMIVIDLGHDLGQ